jgi:glycine dehydrogenase subunit 1
MMRPTAHSCRKRGTDLRYIPNAPAVRERMLREAGFSSMEELFASIPAELRLARPLDLPPALSEKDLLARLDDLGKRNASPSTHSCFLGGGSYRHFIPALVPALISRGEFFTAYTPYQPEISQGTLQAMFEFQSFVCLLTGMEVGNASLYDGASAAAEAVLMARRITGRDVVLLADSLHPEYRETVATYTRNLGVKLAGVPYDKNTGQVDEKALARLAGDKVAALVVQSPNFFGVVEDLESASRAAHGCGALSIAVFAEAFSLGMLAPPGELGADIVAGEGQSFGNPPSFGGPGLGILAAREQHVRKMPGRIVGRTEDGQGRSGFVLTLSTREQHIRREHATSNICSNEGLCALAATVFLSALGREGLERAARQNHAKARRLRERMLELPGYRPLFTGPFFNEFAVRGPEAPRRLSRRLARAGILGGLDLGRWHKDLKDGLLFCATEDNTRGEMDHLLDALRKGLPHG